jgi:hypothetical protein
LGLQWVASESAAHLQPSTAPSLWFLARHNPVADRASFAERAAHARGQYVDPKGWNVRGRRALGTFEYNIAQNLMALVGLVGLVPTGPSSFRSDTAEFLCSRSASCWSGWAGPGALTRARPEAARHGSRPHSRDGARALSHGSATQLHHRGGIRALARWLGHAPWPSGRPLRPSAARPGRWPPAPGSRP